MPGALFTGGGTSFGTLTCSDGVGTHSCTLSGTATGLDAGGFFVSNVSGTLETIATYGELKADVNLNATNRDGTGPGGLACCQLVGVSAQFIDMLTVGGYSGSGFIQYEVTLIDHMVLFGGPIGGGPQIFLNSESIGRSIGTSMFTSQFYSFSSGTPFSLTLGFDLMERLSGGDGFPGADENLAIRLDEVLLFDADMHPISDYTLAAASGASYPTSAVPEPGTLWLLFIVLFACSGLARMQRLTKSRIMTGGVGEDNVGGQNHNFSFVTRDSGNSGPQPDKNRY